MSALRMALRAGSRTLLSRLASGTSTHAALPVIDASWAAAAAKSPYTTSLAPIASFTFVRGFAAPAQEAKGDQHASGPDSDPVPIRKDDPDSHAASVEREVTAESRLEGEEIGKPVSAEGGAKRSEAVQKPEGGTYWLFQPIYEREYVESIEPKHLPPKTFRERLALRSINLTRTMFDKATGYGPNMTEKLWLRRFIFLETVAGVPGMVGGMLRHMHSLRRMKRDHGWIHTLLEEAENERMHLLTFLTLRQPGWFFRAWVVLAQGVFFNFYFLTYLINPKYCHSFVGYLEEEAVKTYTRAIEDLDAGRLPEWEKLKAPEVAVRYWGLQPDAGMRELLLAVRADEAGHSHVNHVLSKLSPNDDNPFKPGSHAVP